MVFQSNLSLKHYVGVVLLIYFIGLLIFIKIRERLNIKKPDELSKIFTDYCQELSRILAKGIDLKNKRIEIKMNVLFVNVINHSDFSSISKFKFFHDLIAGYEKTQIPSELNYGNSFILIKNYQDIRKDVLQNDFLNRINTTYSKIKHKPGKANINVFLDKIIKLSNENETTHQMDYFDLMYFLRFLNLYYLYLAILEDPDSANNLNFYDYFYGNFE